MALEPAGVAFIAENLDQYIRDLGKADEAQQGLGGSAEGSSGKLGILGSVVTGVATAVTTFAIDAVMKLSQAFVGLAQDSIGVAAEFESSMAVLGIAASSTGLQMGELSEAALAVGGDTRLLGVSASGAAGSMTGLFKAGLTAQEVFGDLEGYMAGTAELGGTLRASIDLAAASSLDMVQAADLAAITLATFGQEAVEAGMSTDEWIVQAMDNLVRTADASVAEVEGLQAALTNVGPTAAAFGFSMADVNTSLAILSTRGIQGSEAGTALKSMFTNMMRPTTKVTDALDELGVVLYDNNGVMLSIPEIMGQFEVAMEGLTDQQKNQYIQTIAGTYGMKTMQTLLGEGIEGWIGMEEAIGGAATMMEQGEARSQTLAAQQEALDGVIETLKIRIGTALLPALTTMTTMFSGLIDEYGPYLSAVFESFGAILSENVVPAVETFLGYLSEGHGVFVAFQAALGAVGLADLGNRLANFVHIIRDDFLPVLGRIGQFFQEAFGRISDWFDDNGPAIESALSQIGQVFQAVFGSIWEVIQETVIPAFEEIGASFGEIWEAVKGILEEFGVTFDEEGSGIEAVVGIIVVAIEILGAVISGVLGAATSVIGFFAETFASAFEDIREYIQAWKEQIQGFKDIFTGVLEGDWQKVIKGFGKVFTNAGVMFRKTVKLMVKYITKPFEGLYKLIEGFVKGVIDFFKNLKKKLVGGSIIPDMMDKIEKIIDVVLSAVLEIWEEVFEEILETTEDIFETIERIVDRVMSAIEKIIDTVTAAIGGNWEDFTDLLLELWEETWDDIRDFVDTVFNAIESLIDSIASSIESLWESFTETLEEVWENVWDAIEAFVDTTFNNIENLIDTISGSIETAWNAFTGSVQETWETVWNAIETFVDTTFSNIEALIGTISDSIQVAWETFTSSVQSTWETVWATIETFVDTTFNNIETLIATISGSIQTAWGTFTSSIQSTWETVWGAIETFVDTTFNNIETLIGTISGSIETAWNTFTGAIQSTWETVWSAIETFVNTVFGNVQTAISTISGTIETTWNTWIGNLRSAFETMFNALEGIVNTAMGLVRSAVESALTALASILNAGTNLYNGIMTVGHNIANSIRDGVVALWGNVKGALTTALEALGAAGAFAGQVWGNVKELGWRIVSAIKDGLQAAWGAFTGVVNALRSRLEALKDALGNLTWSQVAQIGRKVVDWIRQGIISGWYAFVQWLKDMILGIFGSGATEVMQATGERGGRLLMESIADGIYANAGAVVDALGWTMAGAGPTGDWVGAITPGEIEAGMMQAAAGFSASLGMVAPAMMAPTSVVTSTEVSIGPNYINDSMDMAEFEVRVRQAVSEAI